MDGSAPHPGPFTVRHGSFHCTIQVSANVLVVAGGWGTEDYVTQYQINDGTEMPLTSLGQPRMMQVLLVTGGVTGGGGYGDYLSSTEVAVYTGGRQLEWGV